MDLKEMKLPGITFTGDIHIQGDMYNIHDNQNVTINMNGKQQKTTNTVEEVFVPRQLRFFDMVTFGSEEKQPKLIAMLREVATQIDTTNGRGWFAIYAGYRYFKQQLAVMGGYTDFFADIEVLTPDLLSMVDKEKEGEARYHNYTVLMGREAALWYMDKSKLPPLNEITVWKERFKGDKNRYSTNAQIIIDVYKRLQTI